MMRKITRLSSGKILALASKWSARGAWGGTGNRAITRVAKEGVRCGVVKGRLTKGKLRRKNTQADAFEIDKW
jgi:hypothetical protein